MKKKISLHDKKGNKFNLDIEFEFNGGRKELTISGEGGGSCGQCLDNIDPDTDAQKKLLEFWRDYHLGGMSSGTPEQNTLLEKVDLKNANKYDDACSYLKQYDINGNPLFITDYNKLLISVTKYQKDLNNFYSYKKYLINQFRDKKNNQHLVLSNMDIDINQKDINDYISDGMHYIKGNKLVRYNKFMKINESHLINKLNSYEIDIPEDLYLSAYCVKYNGKPYMYGHGWTYKTLPEDFEKQLEELINTLEQEEEDYQDRIITIDDLYNQTLIDKADELGIELSRLIAMCVQCEVSFNGLDNIEQSSYDDCLFTIEGNDWLVCTDEEANEHHLQDIKSLVDDIGFEGFRGGKDIDVYIDEDGLSSGDIIISKSITIPSNERGNSLNRRNGNEYEVNIDGDYYYLYKQ